MTKRTNTEDGPMVRTARESEVGADSAPVATYETSPRVDIVESPEGFRVEVEMPGVRTEDIDVDLESGILTIKGRVRAREESGWRDRVREFGPGTFTRSFRLSDTIEMGKITAESKNGLLTLSLPKVQAVKPRSIPVASTN
jgi:HSP20 family protein